MPVLDHPTHEATRIGADHRYGCHSRQRPIAGQTVTGAAAYGARQWPHRMSTECRYDLSLSDPSCTGCPHRGSGEDYDRAVRGIKNEA